VVRDVIPKIQELAKAYSRTLQLLLWKIATHIIEIRSRIEVAFAIACTDADPFRGLATSKQCSIGL